MDCWVFVEHVGVNCAKCFNGRSLFLSLSLASFRLLHERKHEKLRTIQSNLFVYSVIIFSNIMGTCL